MAPAPAARRLTSKPATRPALAQFRYQYAGKGTQAQGAFLDRKRLLAEVLRPVKDPVKLSEHLEGDARRSGAVPANSNSKPSSASAATRATYRDEVASGSKPPVAIAIRSQSLAGLKRAVSLMAFISAAPRAVRWSMQASSNAASRKTTGVHCGGSFSRCASQQAHAIWTEELPESEVGKAGGSYRCGISR